MEKIEIDKIDLTPLFNQVDTGGKWTDGTGLINFGKKYNIVIN